MKKWNLIVDVAQCNNCANCTLAALDEHVGNDFPGYAGPQAKDAQPLIEIRRHVRGADEHMDMAYMPAMCNHCDQPHCAEGAEGAVVKRADGIVLIDPFKAKGRRDLVDKCPHGAIQWNEEQQLPQIWIFDAHLLDAGWTEPRCQQACPSGAYRALKVSDEDMRALARDEGLQVSRPELGGAPRVYYKNLHRMNRRYVAGSVVKREDGTLDCLQGCHVTLLRDGTPVAQATTDWFGDFKVDALPDEPLSYTLVFEHPGFETVRMAVRTDAAGNSVEVVTLAARQQQVREACDA
ncbi:(4Fe-4S)-binding protein [Duganella sp. LX20W]|uniref:(4Fe-4S)-binding protein n=1 Tax=Rugamonas brunnea TaxID=2758569 RepID=A0A7W2I9Y3_9BURK|nr:4Fe-4S dicluster domain-containing protein [Rugamonas brunnea]MBA5635786.1 (4Fe-4S)-binding protein [Rugamonas brunnea]